VLTKEKLMAEIDSIWKSLYKLGGVVSLLLLAYSLVTIVLMLLVGGQLDVCC